MKVPSSRMTITEIAELAGVSKKTVSRYFNHAELLSADTRAKVEAVIADTGFVPNAQARALALQRNFLVALIHDNSDRGVFELVEAGMAQALEGSDLALVLQPLPHEETPVRLRTFLDRLRPAGVVLLPPLSEREDLAEICANAQVRCVRLGRVRGDHGLACNDRSAMATLITWLVRLGHSRIGFIGGPESSLTAQQRELGYLDAMADHHLDRGPSLIVAGDNTFESGISAGRLLLEVSPRPTVIVACNDEMANGVLHAATHAGIAVPSDLSVVGFDDTPLAARTLPPLTSMSVVPIGIGPPAGAAAARPTSSASPPNQREHSRPRRCRKTQATAARRQRKGGFNQALTSLVQKRYRFLQTRASVLPSSSRKPPADENLRRSSSAQGAQPPARGGRCALPASARSLSRKQARASSPGRAFRSCRQESILVGTEHGRGALRTGAVRTGSRNDRQPAGTLSRQRGSA
ncbi:MAG: LacI family DNA-binding transcriptional regulator [Novosphingobium sp.]